MFNKWRKTFRRWLRRVSAPPETSGDTSVLFVLRSRPHQFMTFAEIQAATHILTPSLQAEMERLEWFGRVRIEHETKRQDFRHRRYQIIDQPDCPAEHGSE